jgi:hypothetical protein
MARREKRSVSLPPDLARAVEQAAKAEGTTFSAWLAQTAAHRLKLEAGVLAGKSGHDDIVDVAVVEGAIRRGDAIVTSNVTHIRKVAEAAGAELRIESV